MGGITVMNMNESIVYRYTVEEVAKAWNRRK
uniref:Restriction alleviation protein n=1 Tax=Myoviridae sp. ctxpQ22 TaxID=2826715 RepID=A0A8S5N5M4_9CAUD|nr:MAG TPA: restriction alleviation protein [Myoviridae sp. ctxpQ22]